MRNLSVILLSSVCPLIDDRITSLHGQSVVDPWSQQVDPQRNKNHQNKSKIPNGELVDKTTERNFTTIVNYMGNPWLLLARMFLLLPTICDVSDPLSKYLVNPQDPSAKKQFISY